jgi:hypothetical protein
MAEIYTEDCLDPRLFEFASAGWLSIKELSELKQTEDYDPSIHMEDGSIVGFSSQDQKKRREEILHFLNQLHPALKQIVDAELKIGNRVYDACLGYPQKNSITVTMSQLFTKKYESKKVEFSICNDPHYWRADYRTLNEPIHLLIC